MKRDDETTLQELKDLVIQHAVERGWRKHHSPKNLAISISLEAAELLEHYQWDDYKKEDKQAIADELADLLTYAFNFAATCDIDIATAFREKLERAAKKYPVEIFNPDSDGNDEYFRIKKSYRHGKGENT